MPWNCKSLLFFRKVKPFGIPIRILQPFQSHLLFPISSFMTEFLANELGIPIRIPYGFASSKLNHWRSNRVSKLKLINQTPQFSFTFTIFFLKKINNRSCLFFSFENSLTLVHFSHGVHRIPFKRILTKFLENSD